MLRLHAHSGRWTVRERRVKEALSFQPYCVPKGCQTSTVQVVIALDSHRKTSICLGGSSLNWVRVRLGHVYLTKIFFSLSIRRKVVLITSIVSIINCQSTSSCSHCSIDRQELKTILCWSYRFGSGRHGRPLSPYASKNLSQALVKLWQAENFHPALSNCFSLVNQLKLVACKPSLLMFPSCLRFLPFLTTWNSNPLKCGVTFGSTLQTWEANLKPLPFLR